MTTFQRDAPTDSLFRLRRAGLLLTALFITTGHGFLGIARSAAADDIVAVPRPAGWYVPPGFDGPRAAYDLDAEYAENARRRDAAQPHSFSAFMLREYLEAHHPGATYSWQRAANRGFTFAGTSKRDGESRHEVYVRWQSLSDGLQWGFSETEIVRREGADPFAVIADDEVRSRIRDAVGRDDANRPEDVFLERRRTVVIDQRPHPLGFGPATPPGERYGVSGGGRVRFFTPSGEPLDDPR